jgi:hypothetical protein
MSVRRCGCSLSFAMPMSRQLAHTHGHPSDTVIASDQRERGNPTVLDVVKNGRITPVAAPPQ